MILRCCPASTGDTGAELSLNRHGIRRPGQVNGREAPASDTKRRRAIFGLSWATATKIVTAVVGGGWDVAIVFPWIIPVEATVAGLVAVMGTAAAIAW